MHGRKPDAPIESARLGGRVVRALKRGGRRRVPCVEPHQRRRRIGLGHDGASGRDCRFRRAIGRRSPGAATNALVAEPVVVTDWHGGQRPRQAERVVGAAAVAVTQQQQLFILARSALVANSGGNIHCVTEIQQRAA